MLAADGDEGGRHQLINAAVSNGNLYILKVQVGDKRWFKVRRSTGWLPRMPQCCGLGGVLRPQVAVPGQWPPAPHINRNSHVVRCEHGFCVRAEQQVVPVQGANKGAKGAWNSFVVA